MERRTRRSFLGAAGAGVGVGLALAARPALGQALQVIAPLEDVEVHCGFSEQVRGDPQQLAYGNALRTTLHQSVLDAIDDARGRGYIDQLVAAMLALHDAARTADPASVHELWLRVNGRVNSDGVDGVAELREWEYAARVADGLAGYARGSV